MTEATLLPSTWDVPEIFHQRLGAKIGRQRMMFDSGHLLLVLHQAPRSGEDERKGRFLWRQPDGTWSSSDGKAGPRALARHLEEYVDLIEKYDALEEKAQSSGDYFKMLAGLAPLHRAVRHLHQVLDEARNLIPGDRDLINARDRAYESERMAELLYDGARHALEFAIARRAEEQSRVAHRMAISAHRLNVLAAFFFPIATLCAIFGVNMQHGLENESPPWPILIMVAAGIFGGMILTLFVVKQGRKETS